MNNDQFPFLMLDQNKNNHDNQDEDLDFSKKNYKNFKLEKFEKFKPKNGNSPKKGIQILKGAENKVKSMLSIFLKDIEQENESPEKVNKKFLPKISQKDINTKKINLNTLKRNSISHTNMQFDKPNYNRLGFGLGNSLYFNRNHMNNNIRNINNEGSVVFDVNYKKKDLKINSSKKLNFSNKLNSKESLISIKKKNKKKYTELIENINSNLKSNNDSKNKNKSYYKRLKTYNREKSNIGKQLTIPHNYKNKIKRKNSNKTSVNHTHSLIKKNKSLFSNNINENLKINENIDISNIKEISTGSPKSIKKKNKFKNSNKKNINNIFNESIAYNNSIISEGSECNLNQKSLEEINRLSSTTVNKNMKSLLSKKNLLLTNLSSKNSFVNNNEKLRGNHHSEFKGIKRSSSTNFDKKLKLASKKHKRRNTKLRTIKKQLKKSLIIRPEEIELNSNTVKNNKNFGGSCVNLKKVKFFNSINNNKSKSGTNLIKINPKMKYLSLENINNNKISKKNNSSINNIIVPIPKPKTENTTKNEKINDKEPEKKLVQTKELISKDDSEEELPTDSVKRFNALYNQKYRRIIHRKNIYDSLDDEEFEDAEDINSIYLHPNSNFVLFFDSLLILSGTISFVSTPLYLAKTNDFCRSPTFKFRSGLNMSIEILNILDLFLGFFRAYYNWEEQLIHNNRTIIKKYLSGWFFFDLLAAVPIYTLSKIQEPYCNDYDLSTTYYNVILDKLHYMLLINRLFKIFKIFLYNQAWKILSNKITDNVSMMIYTFFILFALNYAGCLYIFIARNCYPNWILKTNLETSSFMDIYICSIYILIMAITTVGYGDITCYSFHERIFQLILLVVGIMAYSWAVSSFSNYIKKINERSADFEKKKSILDEIKLNITNMPEELYEKILRFLKFKNFHEKKLKNIIFDCLPVSLKNNLICEMYKPIIKNFIFFKNFQNTDFIVRVIQVFKPVIAYKNDILINDNDMVEDIMFVKQGVLSVELPINMSNLQENVDKYLNMSILKTQNSDNDGKMEGSSILNSNVKNTKFKNTLGYYLEVNKNNPILKKSNIGLNTTIIGGGLDSRFKTTSTFGTKQTLSDEKEKEKVDIRYVRILCIRENEHFGDVMMFLEQRSPLRVRVKSKKCELFFLKKMDAINISTSYPNIWRRINKKSVFNFEQIKKSINKIVEIYCDVKKLNSIDEEESSDLYSDIVKESKAPKRESVINMRPKNYDSGIGNMKEINKIRRSVSLKRESNKIVKKILKKNSFDNLEKNKIDKKVSFSSNKITDNIKIGFNNENKYQFSSSSLSSSIENNNKNQKNSNTKLIDTLNGNYKFYKNVKNNNNKSSNIIKEEPGNEGTLSPLQPTESFKNIARFSLSSKNQKNRFNKNNINQYSKKSLKTIKFDEPSPIKLINEENYEMIEKSDENLSNISNNISYDNIINNEIHSGEEIKVNKEENLLFKKISSSYPFIKNPRHDLNNSIEYKNSKLQILLKSFVEKESSEKKNGNINNSSNNNDSSNLLDSVRNKEKNRKWRKNSLLIDKKISLEYKSSYENCNLICGEKLIHNKNNREKLKKFLIEEILNENISNNNSLIELMHNKTTNSNNQSLVKQKEKVNHSSAVYSHKPQISAQRVRRYYSKCGSLFSNSRTLNISNTNNSMTNNNTTANNTNNAIKRTSSLNENFTQKSRKNSFQEGINDLSGKRMNKNPKKRILSTKAVLVNGLNSSPNEVKKKSYNKLNSLMLSPFTKPKKKKDNLLSKINFNIQKTNQNLNNPDLFYSNYFNSLLKDDKSKAPLFGSSMKNIPKMKKDKNNLLLKNYTRKNSK